MPNGLKDAINKLPVHFFGFGLPVGLLIWYGGWSGAAVLVAWRAYEEYRDWRSGRDTLTKSLVDLFSQTVGAIGVAIIRGGL